MALKVRYVDEMYASCGPQYMPDSHTYINVAESSAVSLCESFLLSSNRRDQTETETGTETKKTECTETM